MIPRLILALAIVFVATTAHAAWPTNLPQPLLTADAAHYRTLFKDARKGVWNKAEANKVKDDILLPHAKAELYLSKGYKTSFNEAKNWLEKYGDYPEASEIYRLAQSKREKPTTTCKGKGKKRTCKTVGKYGPDAPQPWVMQKRKIAAAAADEARAREYAGMSAEQASARRKVLGESWRLRSAKKWQQALNHLNDRSTRRLMNDQRWQSELVQIADAQLVPMNWKLMRQAGELAAKAEGPVRDDALWFAGFGAYREGDLRAAANFWEELVRIEPVHGTHAARGAYWAARAHERLGNRAQATTMLEAAARDNTSYYGLLAAGRLGRDVAFNWQEPTLQPEAVKNILRVPAARRALALVQVGEVSTGQMALRTANENIPASHTEDLAALALKLHLPAIAVQMGKSLYPEKINPAIMFPLAEKWEPQGPIVMERPLLLAITRQESAFHPTIGSHVGAQGLMQLMPATARYIVNKTGRGSATNLHDPINNMTLGHDYLAYLQGKTEGDLIAMIAAYNAGLGNVNKWKRRGISGESDPVMFTESIPFDETRGYVQKVLANLWIYESRLNKQSWSLTSLSRNQWPQRWIAIKPSEKDIGG